MGFCSCWCQCHGNEKVAGSYVEYALNLHLCSLCVSLPESNDLLGKSLSFLCLVPCCRDRLVLEQRGDEVSEKSLSMCT